MKSSKLNCHYSIITFSNKEKEQEETLVEYFGILGNENRFSINNLKIDADSLAEDNSIYIITLAPYNDSVFIVKTKALKEFKKYYSTKL
jgi:hypothetical protein